MPKKHQPAYSSIKPTYVHPSLQSSQAGASSSPESSRSVNDRLQQLRREQTPRVTSQRRDEVTEVVSQRTVPPNLRRILHMAEVDAPKPKPGARQRMQRGQRPPPGPAAPTSWLSRSRWAPAYAKASLDQDGSAVGRLNALAKAHNEEFKVCDR